MLTKCMTATGLALLMAPTLAFAQVAGKPQLMIVLDSSGSMTWDLGPEAVRQTGFYPGCGVNSGGQPWGNPTYGDGSPAYPGIDTNGNGQADDSRLFIAKNALRTVLNGIDETRVNLGLMRYYQQEGNGINTGAGGDNENWYRQPGQYTMCGNEATINYDASNVCGQGGQRLEGLGSSKASILKWIDNQESFPGDKEIRGDGATPVAGALRDAGNEFGAGDRCRGDFILLITDGNETCNGDPLAAAREVAAKGIRIFVIGFGPSVQGSPRLNQVAQIGGTAQYNNGQAFFAANPAGLDAALQAVFGAIQCATPCSNDGDCPGTDVCQNGTCAPPCDNNTDCPGQQCVSGHCVTPCSGDAECATGACENGTCVPPCETNTDCPGDKVCDLGVCKPPCQNTGDCPSGKDCVAGVCTLPCNFNGDCPGGQVCEAGHCQTPPPCDTSSDCPSGTACTQGNCLPPCNNSSDCPAEAICEQGTCYQPPPCTIDAHCPGTEACISGICLPPCQDTLTDCPSDFQCVQGQCRPPGNCTENADCIGKVCAEDEHGNRECLPPCQYTSDCPTGQVCELGQCQGSCAEESGCLTPNPSDACRCGGGFECDTGGGICTQTCDVEFPCPAGQQCVEGLCAGKAIDPCVRACKAGERCGMDTNGACVGDGTGDSKGIPTSNLTNGCGCGDGTLGALAWLLPSLALRRRRKAA
jgi:hypothetical protein